MTEYTQHFFVRDDTNPYTEENRFDWIRGYHVGGRSLTWGRQSYRHSPIDFEANAREGIAVDWPIRYEDLAPWYEHVERFIGVSGQAEGLPHLPDSYFQPQRHVYEPFRLSNEAADSDRQFYSVEDVLNEQSKEFDALAMPSTPFIFQDAEILSKETIESGTTKQNRPPPLLKTNNPWILLGIGTSATFDDVQRAYKEMTKKYHPDWFH
jgi:choline dehydrogenase-like flavoprotein